MSKKLYFLWANSGRYDDWCYWLVAGFTDEEAAEHWRAKCLLKGEEIFNAAVEAKRAVNEKWRIDATYINFTYHDLITKEEHEATAALEGDDEAQQKLHDYHMELARRRMEAMNPYDPKFQICGNPVEYEIVEVALDPELPTPTLPVSVPEEEDYWEDDDDLVTSGEMEDNDRRTRQE